MDDEEQTDYIRIHRIKLTLKKIEWAVSGPPPLTKERPSERRIAPPSKCATPLVYEPYVAHSKALVLTIRDALAAVLGEIELVLDLRAQLYLQGEYRRVKDLVKEDPDIQALVFNAR